jgi:hypothetical protein
MSKINLFLISFIAAISIIFGFIILFFTSIDFKLSIKKLLKLN